MSKRFIVNNEDLAEILLIMEETDEMSEIKQKTLEKYTTTEYRRIRAVLNYLGLVDYYAAFKGYEKIAPTDRGREFLEVWKKKHPEKFLE